MAPKKTEKKPLNPRAKGLERIMVRLEPAQIAALHKEALRRAQERGKLKADASELVREALVPYLAKRKQPKE